MTERPWKDGQSPLELAGLVPASPADDPAPQSEPLFTADPAAGVPADWFAAQEQIASQAQAQEDEAASVLTTEDAAEAYDVDQHPVSISFWGIVAPITVKVLLNYQERLATFRIPEYDEEEALVEQLSAVPFHRQKMAEARLRLYMTLLAIDGKRTPGVADAGPPQGAERAAWIKRIPGPFVDALLLAYDVASKQPIGELDRITNDPSSDAARSQSGAF